MDIGGSDGVRRSTALPVKALFEGSVYWLLNIDILLSGSREEPAGTYL